MTTLMQASRQWSSRPADERFLSITCVQGDTEADAKRLNDGVNIFVTGLTDMSNIRAEQMKLKGKGQSSFGNVLEEMLEVFSKES